MFKSGGQAIYEEGKTEGIREGKTEGIKNTILRQGRKSFGPADREVLSAIQAIVDVDRLEALADRILDVKSWEELFEEPLVS